MKNVIFISGIQLFPPESGGQLRSTNIARALCSIGYTVSIYSFTGRRSDYLRGARSCTKDISENLSEYVNRNPIYGIIQFLFYKLHLPPVWLTVLTKFYVPKTLKRKIKKTDTVLLDFPFLYPILSHLENSGIINNHNAEFELYSGRSYLANFVKKLELKSFEQARSIIFCTKGDKDKFILDYPDLVQKSHILPNGIILNDYQFNIKERIEFRKKYNIKECQKVYLFTGSRYAPNQDACNFLITWCHTNAQALKELNCIIMIAGSVSEIQLESDYLKVIGKVPDMKPIFWASDFGINPITYGSGTNLKMIEFIAAQLPTITTNFGSRGLKLADDVTCFIFEPTNLLSTLEKTSKLCEREKNKIAKNAKKENQINIDMIDAMKASYIEW